MKQFKEKEFTGRFDIKVLKKMAGFIKPHLKVVILLSLIMILVGIIDAVLPLLTRYAVDTFIVPGNLQGLTGFIIVYFAVIFIQVINVWFLIDLAAKLEIQICFDIRRKGFLHLQNLSFSYFDKTPVGWIMSRMTSDIHKIGDTIAWGIVDFIWGFTMMTGIVICMAVMRWQLTLVVLSVLPFLVLVSFYFQKKILVNYREVKKNNSKISASFNEGIMGAKTTKTLAREQENLDEFRKLTMTMERKSVRTAIFSALYLPIVLCLASAGVGLALWAGGNDVVDKVISYGTFVAFLSYIALFFEPAHHMARVLSELQYAQASAERIFSMLEEEPEIKDSQVILEKYGTIFAPKPENWEPMKADIEFKNVGFTYKEGQQVLSDFNLKVKAGQQIALVGETGSGKSTIVNLLCRFYEPTEGVILIDGIDYRQRSVNYLHSHLGYMLQSPHLFSGTIRENIRYGNLDARDEEIEQAVRLVGADTFIAAMKEGLDSQAGEGGRKLSTGEKQLVSLARAIIADPRILILDEATSSIDTESEKLIQDAIGTVLEGRTCFIIAHRLSTIKSADRIVVIDKGRILEEGTHHELINKKGRYYTLYTNQFIDEKETWLVTS